MCYKVKGKQFKVEFKDDFEDDNVNIKLINDDDNNNISKLRMIIEPLQEIEIVDLTIINKYKYTANSKIFVNGYQSWTDSREYFVDEKMKSIAKFATPMVKKYKFDKYGDYTFKNYSRKNGEFHGYTYSYVREEDDYILIGSLTERQGFTIIEHYINDNSFIIRKECQGLNISSKYEAFNMIIAKGNEDEVFDNYFELMNVKKITHKPMNGWTSWYNYYQNINEEIIVKNLDNMKNLKKNIDIFQIDDGYQTAVGDWLSIDEQKFPNGMKSLADKIKQDGYKAGIWLAPFACETNSEIYRNKKDWILKDEAGELVTAGSNWSGFYALDFYNEDVRNYIKNVFSVILDDWGYDMVKLDFLYSVCLIPINNKTRGQIMTEAMEFLRECVGDKLILGCGVPLGPSFGLVDYCRIGCDVSLDWDDKPYMRLFHRERVSTYNAIRNSIGRKHLDGRAFLNDPDVFLLRDDNITLTDVQKQTLSVVNNIFGSLIFTSDDISKYNDAKHELFDAIMTIEDRKIIKVKEGKNGLIKVYYKQKNNKYLALINVSKNYINYNFHKYKIHEVSIQGSKIGSEINNKLVVKPFESKIYLITN